MTHSQLIARLEELTGADREVDYDICRALIPDHWIDMTDDIGNPMKYNRAHPEQQMFGRNSPTASVDAALALAAKVLPGWRVENLCEWESPVLRERGAWMCDLIKSGENFFSHLKGKCAHAPTPALALLIAILKAHGAST